MLWGYSARSTKIRSYSARITKKPCLNEFVVQEVLKEGDLSVIAQGGQIISYLRVRPLVLSNTLSQIWDRLNLPMLLFKEGLLTLM